MTTFKGLEIKVIQWAEARGIVKNGTPQSQLLKAISEFGELCDAEGKKDIDGIRDAIGDIVVCLINYCAIRDLDITDCLALAYDQIKDRAGTLMPDGTFVKSGSECYGAKNTADKKKKPQLDIVDVVSMARSHLATTSENIGKIYLDEVEFLEHFGYWKARLLSSLKNNLDEFNADKIILINDTDGKIISVQDCSSFAKFPCV